MPSSQKLWGILARKERWGLSWRGWLAVVLLVLLAGWTLLLETYPFLAVTHRVDAHTLAVEGWVHDFAIQAAVAEFKAGSYERVYATGGPVSGLGHYVNDFQTSASVGAGRLKAAGVPAEFVQMVPSRVMDRDRTYASAVALRDWLRAHDVFVQSINIVTEDVHARRTRLLFQEALGKDVTVGIIAVPNPDYDSAHWWRYSEGVRDVLGEAIAYVYAKFFFYPPAHGTGNETHAAGQPPQ
jgi:uncharacterized SAM-binding protein YcdF (DUF218 family)